MIEPSGSAPGRKPGRGSRRFTAARSRRPTTWRCWPRSKARSV